MRRRRCDNCPAMFTPREKKQRFCSDNCRKTFWKHDSPSFANVRYFAQQFMEKRFAEFDARISKLEQQSKGARP